MLLIECPYCGPRAESEFSCGGEADIARPLHPEQLTDREWGDYLFMRRNPRGPHREQWVHAQGCRRWFRCCAIPSATRSWVTRPSRRARPPPGPMPPGREVRNETGRPTGGRGRIDRSQPLHFTFNGVAYQGYPGDTLASALLANGLRFVARSFKYHRPRGIVAAGWRSNAVVQLEAGPYSVPNARATEIELYQGLAASSVNAEPSLERDRLAINQRLARFLPAGFYYKTFMWPRRLWPRYEARIRAAAGLGSAPDARDAERYDKRYAHCDVLVLGGGPAGLAAADAAAATGARVILVDEQRELGGSLLSRPAEIDGEPALRWAGRIEAGLRRPDVRILTRGTAFGYQDHNLVTVAQRLTDHLPVRMRAGSRELLWKIRAGRVILATGAHERPLVFGNNDLPGVMLASAVSAYIHRYGVLPGRDAVLFTNNDRAYQAAIDLADCGARSSWWMPAPRSTASCRTPPGALA